MSLSLTHKRSLIICAFCAFLWPILVCAFVALLSEPSMRVEEFDTDAPSAVDVVNP